MRRGFASGLLRLALVAGGFIAGSACAQDRLIILSPHWEGIRAEFGRAFREWYRTQTGHTVALDWRDMGGAGDDLRFVVSEFQPSRPSIGIDLFFGGGLDPYLELSDRDLLQPVQLPADILKGIPAQLAGLPLYEAKYRWFGAALSSFGILKNERVVRQMHLPEVKTWKDLANPKLKGWVGSGDPRNSGVMHMIYEIILQAYGWDEGWKAIRGIGANVRQFDRAGSTAAKTCTLGNVAYTIVVDFYGLMQVAEAGPDNMRLILPAAESILNPDCIAVLKGAPNQKAARKFVEFVLSDAGQTLWLAPLGNERGAEKFAIPRMAVRPKLYDVWAAETPVKVNPFRDLKPMRYNAALGTLRRSALDALLGAIVIDQPAERRGTVKVPVTEAELNAIAQKDWKDPVQRSRIQLAWQQGK